MKRTLVASAAALVAVAGLALTTPTIAGTPAPAYATCTEEDGSTPGQQLPCYWGGGANGQGDSYILTSPPA